MGEAASGDRQGDNWLSKEVLDWVNDLTKVKILKVISCRFINNQ
jgi:hypothetical protein